MISPHASVSPRARIADDVEIAAFTVVHDDVVLEAGVRVQEHCLLGVEGPNARGPLVIGEGGFVRSHSVFYAGSTYGPGLSTGHRVTMREGLTVGAGLHVGTQSDFQGDAEIGDYVRAHSQVHLGRRTKVGNFVWIFPFTVFTNDPHPPSEVLLGAVVEDFAIVATSSTILPGVRIGTRSLVAAHSLVNRDVEPDTIVGGVPAKPLGATDRVRLEDGSPAYPWMRHFHRGYPPEVVAAWQRDYPSA